MDEDVTQKAISDGLAEAMEKEADRITDEQQKIRDEIQPLGRIVSEEGQEMLNSLSVSAYEHIRHLRETAALFRKSG
jgi:ATP-dependent Zn protease